MTDWWSGLFGYERWMVLILASIFLVPVAGELMAWVLRRWRL